MLIRNVTAGIGTAVLPVFLLLLAYMPCTGQEVSVPAGHPVYTFLLRLEQKQVVPRQPAARPWSRTAVAELLDAVPADDARVTRSEYARLDRFRHEFSVERAMLAGAAVGSADSVYWHLGRYRGKEFALFGDYVFRQTVNDLRGGHPDQVSAYQRSSGATVWGYLGNRIGFDFYGVDTKESSSEQFSGARQSYFGENVGYTAATDSGFSIYYDKTNAHIAVTAPWFTVHFGKEEQQWGPGRHGQLALSGRAVPFDHMRISGRLGRVAFTSVHGKLSSPSVPGFEYGHPLYTIPDSVHKVYRDRYVAAHRIEVLWPWRIRTAVHEMLFYSDRNMELAYLNPLMFYWSAEHYLNDQDNSTIGLDVSVGTLPHLDVYGEFFLDDLKSDSLGTSWYGNKWAALAGCQYTGLPFIPDADVIVEYARVEPWIYTHRRAANAVSNKGYPLGYWSGPNSDNLSAELRWQAGELVDLSLFAGRSRNGENPVAADSTVTNIGGDIAMGHAGGDTLKKYFLMGEREERMTLQLSADIALPYRPVAGSRYLFFLYPARMRFSYRWSWLTNVLSADAYSPREDRYERQFSAVLDYNFRR